MYAIVFPGQGSQKPGMGQSLFESSQASRAVFESASGATGIDLAALCFSSEEETLRQTQNAQIALFTCGLAALAALKPYLAEEAVYAGHSVGEYAAVVASEALLLEDGARLVQRRGELMAEAGKERNGTMAAILGLDRGALQSACEAASTAGEVVVIANDNCPGQLVVSGDVAAVERLMPLALEAGAKRALPINVSGAFHSPLMESSASLMGQALRDAVWHEQKWTVYANVRGDKCEHGREWAGLLEDQLRSPVRWTESVEAMIRDGVDTFVECGSGEVLCGLIKRISRDVRTFAVFDADTLAATVEGLRTAVSA